MIGIGSPDFTESILRVIGSAPENEMSLDRLIALMIETGRVVRNGHTNKFPFGITSRKMRRWQRIRKIWSCIQKYRSISLRIG